MSGRRKEAARIIKDTEKEELARNCFCSFLDCRSSLLIIRPTNNANCGTNTKLAFPQGPIVSATLFVRNLVGNRERGKFVICKVNA